MNIMTTYLGLGSNLGDKRNNIIHALSLLQEKTDIRSISSLYETEPWGFKKQPIFLNAACEARTDLDALDLLDYLKSIETRLGRTESFAYGPRVLDIDILFYGNTVFNTSKLTIPHPSVSERKFVLVPLAEIAPNLLHPISNKTISELLSEIVTEERVEYLDPYPYMLKSPQ
jgi:2-amino-4-hydroxy-6-hydroxymethyldihydropteridine diphosphokinase